MKAVIRQAEFLATIEQRVNELLIIILTHTTVQTNDPVFKKKS